LMLGVVASSSTPQLWLALHGMMGIVPSAANAARHPIAAT
jgi:hypothetical protein